MPPRAAFSFPTKDHNLGESETDGGHHFNYRELKMAEFEGDNFKRPGRQHKDILEAVTSAGESVGHPAQKTIALFSRLLAAIAGRPVARCAARSLRGRADDHVAGLVASRLRPLWSAVHPHGVAQRGNLPHQRRSRRRRRGHPAVCPPQQLA